MYTCMHTHLHISSPVKGCSTTAVHVSPLSALRRSVSFAEVIAHSTI